MSKYEDIRTLAGEAAERISRSAQGWMGYLDTASRMCRYPFADSLLIHAQRPDAVACASLDVWDHRMGRWVRRGAKGIALIDDDGPRRRLRYVFDISDTYRPRGGQTPFLWQMGEQHRGAISGHLREDYMLAGEGADGLQGALLEIASGLADEGIEDILTGMERETRGIFTDGPVGDGPLPRFKVLLGDSVFYLLSRRCGLDPMERLGEGAFAGITEFGDMAMLAFLGDTSSSLAAPVLANIGREMHKLCREEARQKAVGVGSAAPSKGVADSTAQEGADVTGGGRTAEARTVHTEQDKVVDAAQPGRDGIGQDRAAHMGQDRADSTGSAGSDKTDSAGSDKIDAVRKDGSDGAGYDRKDEKGHAGRWGSAGADTADLPSQRGLSVPGSDDRGGAGGDTEVRDAAEEVPESASERAVPEHAPDREAGQPSGGDRPGRRGADGDPDGKAVGEPSGTGQGGGPDGVGRAYGGPDGHGGGDHLRGTGVQLRGEPGEGTTGEDPRRAEAEDASALALQGIRQDVSATFSVGPSDLPTVGEQVRKIGERMGTLYAGRMDLSSDGVDAALSPDRERTVQAGEDGQLSLADFMDMGTGMLTAGGSDGHGADRSRLAGHGHSDGGRLEKGEDLREGTDGARSQGEERQEDEGQGRGEQAPEGGHPEGQDAGEGLLGGQHLGVGVQEGQHPGAEAPEEGPSGERSSEEQSLTAPTNFRIKDDDLGAGGPKQKFKANMAAIRLLKQLEADGRQASEEEQEVLSRFVGWGGIPQAFDERDTGWSREYAELGQALTPEEYKAARASTLNAFYTPPVVIKAMYGALRAMGLEAGNVLEPACGIGNFMGLVPEGMEGIRMYGVELDSISGRIARQLYPENAIEVRGFETTGFPDSFFDCVTGNVPFGDYRVVDPKYDRHHFLIHDHFIAKSLDLVRPGGIVAVVTSSGTMDKEDSSARRYFAARADLLGAIRLPEDAFWHDAGTSVVADILFFQKRDRAAVHQPDWVGLKAAQDGYLVNAYFADHPEMVLGRPTWGTGRYGRPEMTVKPETGEPLAAQLERAAGRIQGRITGAEPLGQGPDGDRGSILADPSVRDYSFTDVDGEVYYRIGSRMERMELPAATKERVLGMAGIRDTLQELIRCQMEDGSDGEVAALQRELDERYDRFTARHGLIGSSANRRAFSQDSSYCLLASLEHLDAEGRLIRKADIFTKRTIQKARPVTSVDTASEALAVSIGERARVDLPFMAGLAGMEEQRIIEDLAGVIFKDPATGVWETSDAYLSGNVREKLRLAKEAAEDHPEYAVNVRCLERVQPEDLEASQIEARLGAPWIGQEYITQFMGETFHTPKYLLGQRVAVRYTEVSGQWHISEKGADGAGDPLVTSTYGTRRANAYRLLEDALNLRDTRIYDTAIEDGKEKRVLNKQETILAQQKQGMIREAFKDWVFQDMERRVDLCRTYNERFNSIRPREYDGQHIRFVGMDPRITLLAHCVGAGKTFQMIAAGMESRRLGLSQKNLYVVPNHLIEQWAGDFLRLYPGANILAATKKDFEPMERKRFCSRIATGEYDGIIIGQSQFERIPLSKERQAAYIERQIEDITMAIVDAETEEGARYTVKQMEKTKRSLEAKLAELNDRSRKDDVVTFEQLGVDRLFIDESQAYKNLFLHTKMRNVAGISQTDAKKSSDLFMKCRYLDEVTGGRGVVFASGTPVSNSVTELYSLMRYLQYDTLQEMGLGHFDSWAAAFGETVTSIELSPEGTGYRARTRFARFFNLPELMSVFKECADIKTADQLDLPVPEAEYVNVVLQPSEEQRALVRSFADRAERVRKGGIDPSVDNMLAITNDGRKCALDQRLLDDMLPDDPGSKVNHCVQDVYSIWEGTMGERSTQIIFCDSSTPKKDGSFNIYDDVREKLVARGIPREEIAFIHEAGTEAQKEALFAKVRSGQVRVLMGSTAKLGAGTNVQDRLIALYHLDCPWRPADLEQQEGRILRQGNRNRKVRIFRYVTKDTFDAYLWQILENKQKFISQIMTSRSPVRSCEDIDDAALSYAEVKALATGDPYIREKMTLDMEVGKLKLLKAGHDSQRYRMETDIAKTYPARIAALEERIRGLQDDGAMAGPLLDALAGRGADGSRGPGGDGKKAPFSMTVDGERYTDRKRAGAALIAACQRVEVSDAPCPVGMLPGFMLSASYDLSSKRRVLTIKGRCSYRIEVGKDPLGNLQRIRNALAGIEKELPATVQELESVRGQLGTAKAEVSKPFPQEAELKEKMARLAELDALLDIGGADRMGGYEGQDAEGSDSREGEPEDGEERIHGEDGPPTKEDGPPAKEDRPPIKEDRLPTKKDRPLTREDLKRMRGQSMGRPAGWQGAVKERGCSR